MTAPRRHQTTTAGTARGVLSILTRDLGSGHVRIDGCDVVRVGEPTYDDYLQAAFDQIRVFAADQPPVQLVLVRTLVAIGDELRRRQLDRRDTLDAVINQLRYVDDDLSRTAASPSVDAAKHLLSNVAWYSPKD